MQFRRLSLLILCGSILLTADRLAAVEQKLEMFPFVLPWDDASPTIVDVSRLNPAPIDESRRISVKGPHFVDGTGRRVKFFGVNLVFRANFPEKGTAEKMAARMRKFGINAVRLHHMDMFKAPSGIFDPKKPGMQNLDSGQLDRLDYLVSQFKKNGIYIDLNLHVSRAFTAEDGFPDAGNLPGLGKVTGYFEPTMIELQKKYARDLLTHKNPYTKLTWAEDPIVALIEINNEDTLLGEAFNGVIRKLPSHYRAELEKQWNIHLASRYASTGALKQAWNRGNRPLGSNVIRNPGFTSGVLSWNLETHGGSQARMAAEKSAGTPFPNALRVNVLRTGAQPWHVQLHQQAIDLKPGETYTVSFQARSEQARKMSVYAGLSVDPWTHVGLDQTAELREEWREHTFTFTAGEARKNQNRLVFVLGNAPGNVWISDVSLQSGAETRLASGESLEKRNVSLPDPGTGARGEDFVSFLMEVERRYADGMRAYIQDELKAGAPVTCSQAQWGGIGGLWRESKMDWIDTHAYWQHPSFPAGREWNPREWWIKNTSMVSDPRGGTFPNLAMYRMADKPFTVSEYNHPAPNDFSAETMPLLAYYAARNDWDGVFLFDYTDRADGPQEAERIRNFFSIESHPGKMALMPAAASVFLGGNKITPEVSYIMSIPSGRVVKLAARYGWDMRGIWSSSGAKDLDFVKDGTAIKFVPGDGAITVDAKAATVLAPGSWDWNRASPDSALFHAAVPGSHTVVGFARETSINSDDSGQVTLTITPRTRGFVAITVTAMDGKPTSASSKLLLTALGRVENSGMGWNSERTSVGDQWGKGPTLVEGVSAAVNIKTLAGMARVHALDGTGARKGAVNATLANGRVSFNIGPEHKTLWYEVELLAAPGIPKRGGFGGASAKSEGKTAESVKGSPGPIPVRGDIGGSQSSTPSRGPVRGIPRFN